jgi:hypothetical protein
MEPNFKRGLWKETIYNSQRNLLLMLGIVVALLALSVAQDIWKLGTGGNVGATFAWVMLAIAAHATILKGQSGYIATVDQKVLRPFMVRAFAFAAIGIIGSLFTIPFWGDGSLGRIILAMLPAYGLTEALLLAKWGTWLPAVVAEGDRSFSAAGRRGSVAFGYVCLRLVFCNGVLLAIAFITLAIALNYAGSDGEIWTQESGFNVGAFAATLTFFLTFAFQTVMLATVLSRAYLIAEAKLSKPIQI